jgi:molybdopterin/thiamine biosynthesis adenylyltransferase
LILAGPKQVTIYDPSTVAVEDVGRNFYCRAEHVGKVSRAEASLSQLKDLNPGVNVNIGTDASVDFMYRLS